MIPLATSKKFKLFPKTCLFFLESKNFLDNLRKLPHSVAFHSKIANQSFQGEFIFLENPCKFLEQPKVWTIFIEMLVFQLNSTAKLLPQANFYNFNIFIRKTHFFILKKPEVWTFWGLLQFRLILRQVCCLCHLKEFSSSRKTEVFFNTSKSQKLNVLRNLTNSFALYSKFATIRDFSKFQGFFRKTHFFAKNTAFERFEKSHCSVRIQHQIG